MPVFFTPKMSCLKRDLNPQHTAYCADALPTKPPKQLSWAGQILKGYTRAKHLSPDKQTQYKVLSTHVRLPLFMYSVLELDCMHVHVCMHAIVHVY